MQSGFCMYSERKNISCLVSSVWLYWAVCHARSALFCCSGKVWDAKLGKTGHKYHHCYYLNSITLFKEIHHNQDRSGRLRGILLVLVHIQIHGLFLPKCSPRKVTPNRIFCDLGPPLFFWYLLHLWREKNTKKQTVQDYTMLHYVMKAAVKAAAFSTVEAWYECAARCMLKAKVSKKSHSY